ncbi:MAG: hypothetical protein H6867_04100 [Rhodospirillales bacterium]|nr:hypothetical protein [Rhodospirillales bacterium]MCB9996333.1 hypothetical protein [Rhodospirillales bacterium]
MPFSRVPKQWKLITLYIIFIYAVYIGMIHYAKRHPIIDEHQTQSAAP